MKVNVKMSVAAALGVLALSPASQAVSFDYSSIPDAGIVFDGASHFSFTGPVAGFDFQVDTGSAATFFGNIDGVFTIGAVVAEGGGFSAPVSGTGTITIFDGGVLTADIEWVKIFQRGTGGTLNVEGAVNMTNIQYVGGANADLEELAEIGWAYNVLTFQFIPAKSLNQLKTQALRTSFSGSILAEQVPDGGTSAVLLGIGLVGFGALVRRRS